MSPSFSFSKLIGEKVASNHRMTNHSGAHHEKDQQNKEKNDGIISLSIGTAQMRVFSVVS